MNKNESVFKKVINKEKKKNNKSKLIRILKNISKEENSKPESVTFDPVSLINAEMRRKITRKKKYRKYINRRKGGNYFEQAGHFKTGQRYSFNNRLQKQI